jgi:hypothetical protein
MPTYSSANIIKPKGWEEFEGIVCSAAKRWSNVPEYQAFADQVSKVLNREIQREAAGVDSTELSCAVSQNSSVQP